MLRYDGVTTIEAYVEVMADRLAVPTQAMAPSVASPLGLVATLDYLNLAWRVAFKAPGPVVFPSGERTAKLCFPVQTVEEFDSRLSALWDLLKHLQVQGPGSHSLERLQAFLLDQLEEEAHDAIRRGIEVLQCVRLVRHAGQHTEAGSPALATWGKFGLSYPPASWSEAWQVIQVRVIEALDLIRQELPVAEG